MVAPRNVNALRLQTWTLLPTSLAAVSGALAASKAGPKLGLPKPQRDHSRKKHDSGRSMPFPRIGAVIRKSTSRNFKTPNSQPQIPNPKTLHSRKPTSPTMKTKKMEVPLRSVEAPHAHRFERLHALPHLSLERCCPDHHADHGDDIRDEMQS